jgi:hypothetical protein
VRNGLRLRFSDCSWRRISNDNDSDESDDNDNNIDNSRQNDLAENISSFKLQLAV